MKNFSLLFNQLGDFKDKIGIIFDEDKYDSILIKKLAKTNTLQEGGKSHQTHIALTGNEMDIFPKIISSNYHLAKGADILKDLKRFFVLKNEILLKKDNLNYISDTNKYFDDIHTSTTTGLSKRTDESLQLELSYIDKDGDDFIKFRKFLNEGDYIIFLKTNNLDNYIVLGLKGDNEIETGVAIKKGSSLIKQTNIVREASVNYGKIITNNTLTSQESLLLLSLLTKPFSILYGVSGTGKSRVVKELWKKIYGEDKYKEYFSKESVPPNWFDETEVFGRYNVIEGFIKGSFTKILEKAINDSENNYVYLLDEMNLSHIEQYFAQYLSAVEDLDTGNAWLHIGDTTSYSIKKNLKSDKLNEIEIDINNPISVVKKYSFVKGTLDIDGTEIKSDSDLSDFHKKIFKHIIDNQHNESGDYGNTGITTIEELQKEGYIISNEERVDFEKEGGTTFYVKKDNWANTNNYFFYKGYVLNTMYDYNSRIKEIKKLVEYIGVNYLGNLHMIFSPYKDIEMSIQEIDENKNIINYYNEDNRAVGISLKIPKNLFVVGTINLDETTKSISPKVIDRSNLIEFNDIDNYTFFKDNGGYDLEFLEGIKFNEKFNDLLDLRLTKEKWNTNSSNWKIDKTNEELLQKLYDYLKKFKLHFSYRTINEILTFVAIGKKLLGKDRENKLLDLVIMQKVLPKLNGVIDPSFKLSHEKFEKYLYYNLEESVDSILSNQDEQVKNLLKEGIFGENNEFINTSIKLQRMQQFFDTYQNVNYFLS